MSKYFDGSWMKFLDWSRMKMLFEKLPKDKQQIILNEGYWSKGKGIFDIEEIAKCSSLSEKGSVEK
jgi:hypothetical protein